jgi:hypothetical protein
MSFNPRTFHFNFNTKMQSGDKYIIQLCNGTRRVGTVASQDLLAETVWLVGDKIVFAFDVEFVLRKLTKSRHEVD